MLDLVFQYRTSLQSRQTLRYHLYLPEGLLRHQPKDQVFDLLQFRLPYMFHQYSFQELFRTLLGCLDRLDLLLHMAADWCCLH